MSATIRWIRTAAVLSAITVAATACHRHRTDGLLTADSYREAEVEAAGRRALAQRDSAAAAAREAEARDAALAADRAAAVKAVESDLTQPIYFDFDSAELPADAKTALLHKADLLKGTPQLRIRIEGHTDARGSSEYNLALGERRAMSVRDFLSAYGVDVERMGTTSYGKERPAVDGDGEAAWAKNRRAEFVVVGSR